MSQYPDELGAMVDRISRQRQGRLALAFPALSR